MGSTYYSKRYKSESGRQRMKRPRTFSSSDEAKKWAAKNNIEKFDIRTMPYSLSGKVKLIIPQA